MKSNRYTLPINKPIILAPLAGVSDFAFRLMCQRGGADLTYVEMLSSCALIHKNEKTLKMLYRHPEEKNLGVQITGRNSHEISEAAKILSDYPFETLDINMGCPVKKVVKVGSGSALLRDPEEVYQITSKTVAASRVPVSVKIRLGWDLNSRNFMEVTEAIEKGGAAWVTVHGRTRSQNYSDPVDLHALFLGEARSRSVLRSLVKVKNKYLLVYNVHLTYNKNVQHTQEVNNLVFIMEKDRKLFQKNSNYAKIPALVMGDFNTDYFKNTSNYQELKDKNYKSLNDQEFTGFNQGDRLDLAFISEDFESFFEIVSKNNNGDKGVRVLPRLESDHYPILLEIKEK